MKPSHCYLRQSLLTGNKTEITPKAYSAIFFIKDYSIKRILCTNMVSNSSFGEDRDGIKKNAAGPNGLVGREGRDMPTDYRRTNRSVKLP